jgi:DNA-binding response OmpR family regulator
VSAPAPKTVLVVEDDPGMLEFLARAVRDAGYEPLTATDGLQVLELARARKPDAVVLDLMLPHYGGMELLLELRRGSTAAIPLIVVTARFTGVAERSAITAQPNVKAFFEKPVSQDELLEALRRVLPA